MASSLSLRAMTASQMKPQGVPHRCLFSAARWQVLPSGRLSSDPTPSSISTRTGAPRATICCSPPGWQACRYRVALPPCWTASRACCSLPPGRSRAGNHPRGASTAGSCCARTVSSFPRAARVQPAMAQASLAQSCPTASHPERRTPPPPIFVPAARWSMAAKPKARWACAQNRSGASRSPSMRRPV